jgi:hypothetical protein
VHAQAQQAMGFSYYYSPGSGVPPSAMSAEEGVLMQAAEAALALAQATSSEANLTGSRKPLSAAAAVVKLGAPRT